MKRTEIEESPAYAGNGWTKYQLLVLSELKRHESKQEALHGQLGDIHISQGKFEVEMKNYLLEVKRIADKLSDMETDLTEKVDQLNKAREASVLNVSEIKWQIGMFSAGLSVVGALALELILKLMGH